MKLFKNIEKCLSEYRETDKKIMTNSRSNLTDEERDIVDYFDLHLAEAIMKDFRYYDKGVKVAKIILAMQELKSEWIKQRF